MDQWKSVQIGVANTSAAEDWISELARQVGACGAAGGAVEGEWILYFRSEDYHEDLPRRIAVLADAAGFALGEAPVIDTVARENWNEAWKEFYRPVQVTPGIRVLPAWMPELADDVGISLLIEPGMAFGTGTHETTQLCMKQLEKHIRRGDNVLDAGTGTGILLITALKLGARIGIGFDVDPDIRENAALNLQLNGIGGKQGLIYVGAAATLRRAKFDLILCNMLSTQFLPILEELFDLCTKKGRMILSGLLTTEQTEVVKAVKSIGAHVIDEEIQGEWSALTCARDPAADRI